MTAPDTGSPSLRLIRAARAILPGPTPVERAGLLVDAVAGRLVEVGSADDLARRHPQASVDDWGEVLLIPGLVNGHAHTFQSLLRGPGDDLDFARWRDEVLYPSARWLTAEDIETGALLAAADMLLAGVTTVAEFFYLNDQGNAMAQTAIEALRRTGIRTLFGRAMYDGALAPSRYRERPLDAFDRVLALANRYPADPLVRVLPAPHSLHAASPEMIRLGAEAAERLDTVFTIHVAEGLAEVRELMAHTGQLPAAYLDGLGALGPRSVLVHGVHLGERDLRTVAARGARVVHNPGANAMLGDGVAPLVEMRALGIPIALGTDGGCTNNRLSILDEMRLAVLLQRATRGDGGVLTARDAYAMGTVEAASVFGLDAGELRGGALADVVALDLADPGLLPEADPVSNVVYSASPRAVRRVLVHGREVVRDGRVLGVDRNELRQRVAASLARAARSGAPWALAAGERPLPGTAT
jgi:5-methylthioadenosine/S-adenosylhomocysteine deaminase